MTTFTRVADVTVSIPCFEQSEYLPRALNSVLEQTLPALEIIVVDDGSHPAEKEKIAAICAEHLEVRYVRVTNRGLPAARNTALMLARGAWFLPVDADDWLDPTYIEKTTLLGQRTHADVVLTGIQEHGPSRNGAYLPGYDRPWQDVTAELILTNFNRFFYCSLLKTKMLRQVGGYNSRMDVGLEDADLWVDLLRRGVKFTAVNEMLFNYDTSRPDGMLQKIHRDGGYELMVAEMRRHHGFNADQPSGSHADSRDRALPWPPGRKVVFPGDRPG